MAFGVTDGSFIYLPSSLRVINQAAFSYFPRSTKIAQVVIGGEGNPSQLTTVENTTFVQNSATFYLSYNLGVTVYISAGSEDSVTEMFALAFGSNANQTLSLITA